MLATTHAPLGRPTAPSRPRRVRDLMQAAIVHGEDADLVRAAEAVLLRPDDAVLAARIALEVQHRIDEMLE